MTKIKNSKNVRKNEEGIVWTLTCLVINVVAFVSYVVEAINGK